MYYAEWEHATGTWEYFVDAGAVLCYTNGHRIRVEIKNGAVEVSIGNGRLSLTRDSSQTISVRKETA